jgi:hypothetical protein
MIGLALAVLALVWLLASLKVAILIAGLLKSEAAKWVLGLIVFAVLLALPLADEIVAVHQVETVCREGAVLKVDAKKIEGRRVVVASNPLNAPVPGVTVPVTYSKLVMRDADTGEELGSRGSYVITGGWLIRSLSISESNSPMVIRSYCAPAENAYQAASRLGFQIID